MLSRLMIKYTMLCFAVAALASPLAAQNKAANPKPDFTGTWLLDTEKSDIKGPTSRWDLPMKVSHREPEFRITHMGESNGQVTEFDFLYFTDGRSEANRATTLLTTNPQTTQPSDVAKQEVKSKTTWSGNKIVVRAQQRMSVAGHVLEFEIVDEWQLSSDGKTLTQRLKTVFREPPAGTVFMPGPKSDKKRVYNRV